MLRTDRNFVFAYGSLLPRADSGEETAVVCHLDGFRRGWNVAMDNAVTIPGYKYYVDPETGERPAVYVAYLDLAPNPETTVNGVLFPAAPTAMKDLDARERNYERREVTGQIDRLKVAHRGSVPQVRARLDGLKRVEAALRIPRKTFRAEAEAEDVPTAIDRVKDKLERQLRDHHGRKRLWKQKRGLESALTHPEAEPSAEQEE